MTPVWATLSAFSFEVERYDLPLPFPSRLRWWCAPDFAECVGFAPQLTVPGRHPWCEGGERDLDLLSNFARRRLVMPPLGARFHY